MIIPLIGRAGGSEASGAARARPPGSARAWRAGLFLIVALAARGAAADHATVLVPLADPALAAQRASFQHAEDALAAGERGRFERALRALRGYPLYPYLLYAALHSGVRRPTDATVHRFLERYRDTPLAPRLRRAWLHRLAAAHRWKAFLAFWRPQADVELRCNHARALLAEGHRARAFAEVDDLWLSERSRPKQCNRPFDAWLTAGRLTPALLWKRIELAIGARQSALVAYLRRLLPPGERRWVARWRRARRNPEAITDTRRFPRRQRMSRRIIADVLLRIAPYQPSDAARLWGEVAARYAWPPEQRATLLRAIALGFAGDHLPGSGARLARVPARAVDTRVRLWRVRTALRHRRWRSVLADIDALSAQRRHTERWRYWRARALAALGKAEAARRIYARLATQRSYYGFLSADRLHQPYQFAPHRLRFTRSALLQVADLPGVLRARELQVLGRVLDSRREWYGAIGRMGQHQLRRAAVLAHMWGWAGRTILTLARANDFDDLSLRFPLAYRRAIESSAASDRVDPAWLLAVARQESAFIPDARSPAGALGIMQLMPATGRRMAHALGLAYHGEHQLLDPHTSIRLGARYLHRLLHRFDGSAALATAAYNAGPTPAERWRPEQGALPADIWIETVPYGETRRYLQRVLFYATIYQYRLGRTPTRLLARLGRVPGLTPGPEEVASASPLGSRRHPFPLPNAP